MTSISDETIRTETLGSYDKHLKEYLHKKDILDTERTQSYWAGVEFFLGQLSVGDTIFEIGSGSGYDARHIEENGFIVERSDASLAFIEQLKISGVDAVQYDVLDGPTPNKYPAIYANAVLLHFNERLFDLAVENIVGSLKSNGLFCLGMKLGEFEGWREKGLSGKRYFKFWHQHDLRNALEQHDLITLNETPSKDGKFIIITTRLNKGSKRLKIGKV